ncbi:MAG: helix-turn-helix transcriptional regulator [Clostridium sp.]|uniref:helix-turn-helix domain-containing protein n=1 Tax=Clostridium sp. TaxID=1506 RepID=UPI00291272E8|nr:helix-turn-helix transcriptional regulator [Clostridium sp.]MDU5211113.1 helix-turn-helix transcriptional regulator [Clostridium sp.]MDU6762240.1 helix-turn-helix transcriptional regulator [Clostridium sp.]
MEVGLRIKEIRELSNISQEKLARKTKILNQSQICKIENGQRALKANELSKIADVLNVPITEIIS